MDSCNSCYIKQAFVDWCCLYLIYLDLTLYMFWVYSEGLGGIWGFVLQSFLKPES